MKKVFSLISFASLLTFGLASCNCEDVGWKPVEPVSQIQGTVLISEKAGVAPSPVDNATINVTVNSNSYTAKTDGKGYYCIHDVEAGSAVAEVTVTEAGIHGYAKHVTIEKSAVATCNFILTRAVTEVVHEKIGDDDVYSINLPDVIQKDKEVVQIATYYCPDGTLEEDEDLKLEAWYELRPNVYQTKAAVIPQTDEEGFKYTGDNIDITVFAQSSIGEEESIKPFTVEVKDLMEPVCVTHNGKEIETTRDKERNVSVFRTKEYGKTVLTYPIYVKKIREGQDAIAFDPAEYMSDGKDLIVNSRYVLKSVEYNWEELTPSILWQYAVLMTGYYDNGIEQFYNDAVSIPKGETIVLDGRQHYQVTRFKCGWAYVDAKIYDQVYIQYKDRKHTGGSN